MSAGAAPVGTVSYGMGLVRVVEAAGFPSGPRRSPPANGITVISNSSAKMMRTVAQNPVFKPKGVNGTDLRPPQILPGSSKLKELLLTQLDLIQKQSEALLTKDKQLRQLQKENRDLVSKLNKFKEEEPPAKKRRKVDKCVETSKDLLERVPVVKKSKKDKDSSRKPEILETHRLYFTHNGEEHVRGEKESVREILSQSEVPQWRISAFSPSNEVTGEKLEDDFILKRHKKPELQEKQRKRWDMQRMRQLKQVEHLRARYDSAASASDAGDVNGGDGSSVSSDNPERIKTFYPDPNGVQQIIVSETFPVSAFGYPLPDVGQGPFSLPWGQQL